MGVLELGGESAPAGAVGVLVEVTGDDPVLAGFELATRDDDAGATGPLRYSFLDYQRAER